MPISRIYLAPMEGVTTFIYRNAHAAVYGPLDKYFTPFLEPHEKRSMKTKERNEVLSQHNEGPGARAQAFWHPRRNWNDFWTWFSRVFPGK